MSKTVQLERDLVERIAHVFEGAGLAPIAGRILGRLLLCDPAEQSSTELADWLGASKGSISTQTQLLVRAGFISRKRRSGSRAIWYALQPHVWSDLLTLEVMRTSQLHRLGHEAIELKREVGAPIDERLREFTSFSAFFMERLPGLIREWKVYQAGLNDTPKEMT